MASCLHSPFLHSSGRQAEPLGFHNKMFCLFLLFWKETDRCLPAFLASFSVHSFCCTFSVWEGHYMRQCYDSRCLIHKGVSRVLTVKMTTSVNLNNQLLPKMFSRHFFTPTDCSSLDSKWSVAFLCPGMMRPTLDRVLQLRPQLMYLSFLKKDHIMYCSMVYSFPASLPAPPPPPPPK